jgi:hypothetical protein
VEFDDSGFRLIQDGKVLHEISWTDIDEIFGFKRDCLIYDVICLGFRIDETDQIVEVAEDFPGFDQFLEALEQRFSLKSNWWRKVAVPAFETNWTTMWKKPIADEDL